MISDVRNRMKKAIIMIAVMGVLAFAGYQVAKLFPSYESHGWTRTSPDGKFRVAFMKVSKTYRDGKIERYFELGCEVKGLGRGHINRIKDNVRKKKMEPDSS